MMAMVQTMTESGRGPDGDADGEFLFCAESLALDLVNTQMVVRGKPRDLLQTPADLVAWWRVACRRYPDLVAPAAWSEADLDSAVALAEAKHLRAALRRLFGALVDDAPTDQADLDVLNRVLTTGYQAVERSAEGDLRAIVGVRTPQPAALLPVALAALRLATGADRRRLHRCANDRCVLLFYDTTKSATRRWCSVACMNRARSIARYRARRRGAPAANAPRTDAPSRRPSPDVT